MNSKTRVFRQFIVAVVFLITSAFAKASADKGVDSQAPPPLTSVFNISFRGTPVGQETVTVSGTAAGWTISSTGGQTAPAPVTIDKFEVAYTRAWHPVSLVIEARSGDQLLSMRTSFTATSATNDVMQGGEKNVITQQISQGSIVLPNNFFGA
jgi:hypothetical protein